MEGTVFLASDRQLRKDEYDGADGQGRTTAVIQARARDSNDQMCAARKKVVT